MNADWKKERKKERITEFEEIRHVSRINRNQALETKRSRSGTWKQRETTGARCRWFRRSRDKGIFYTTRSFVQLRTTSSLAAGALESKKSQNELCGMPTSTWQRITTWIGTLIVWSSVWLDLFSLANTKPRYVSCDNYINPKTGVNREINRSQHIVRIILYVQRDQL